MQVIWNHLYKSASFSDKGTLKQLTNLISWTNIPQTVKKDFAATQDFFSLVLDAHIVAAAMNLFDMKDVSDTPKQNDF